VAAAVAVGAAVAAAVGAAKRKSATLELAIEIVATQTPAHLSLFSTPARPQNCAHRAQCALPSPTRSTG
jgi:hypothetical protein